MLKTEKETTKTDMEGEQKVGGKKEKKDHKNRKEW